MSYEPMSRKVTAIYTPHKHVRVGSWLMLAGSPMIEVRSNGDEDSISLYELIATIYGKKVRTIIFEEDSIKK